MSVPFQSNFSSLSVRFELEKAPLICIKCAVSETVEESMSNRMIIITAGLLVLLTQLCMVSAQDNSADNAYLDSLFASLDSDKAKRQTEKTPSELFETIDAPTEQPTILRTVPSPRQTGIRQTSGTQQTIPQTEFQSNGGNRRQPVFTSQPQPQPQPQPPVFSSPPSQDPNTAFYWNGIPEQFRGQIFNTNSGFGSRPSPPIPPAQNIPVNGGWSTGYRTRWTDNGNGVRDVYTTVNGGPTMHRRITSSSGFGSDAEFNEQIRSNLLSQTRAAPSFRGFPSTRNFGFSNEDYADDTPSNFYRVSGSQTSFNSNDGGPVTRHFHWDSRNGGRTFTTQF